jgi:hypothetical protein
MSAVEIAILVILVAYAIYRQTQRNELTGSKRFKLAIIYGTVGLVIGGFHLPDTTGETALLIASIALSLVVGLARGWLTVLSVGEDGRLYSQGTVLTVSLFLGMVAVKFAMGTAAYFIGISEHGGFGEVLLMIAVMVALQAEVLWRRGQRLRAAGARPAPAVAAARPA